MAKGNTSNAGAQGAPAKTIKKVLTQEDFDAHPDLVTQGLKVGDEIEIPQPKAAAQPKAIAADHIEVDGKLVKVKFGGHFPDMGKTYTKEDLLADVEAVAYLLEIGSGAVQIVEPTK